ncbi:hypothetical protein GJ496_007780 [Pomphorhynchus laevis]|nr:hypothetical protein GJ496_007780 [Pomphorhynchus laevis]
MSPAVASSSGGADSEPKGRTSTLRQRRTAGANQRSTASANSRMGGGGMWRFYTEDSPGIKIGPLPVLVFSLSFIASVFVLHIWGKLMRS